MASFFASDSALQVADYTPEGVELDTHNFESALNAAVAAARETNPSPAVRIPAGVWPMTQSLVVRGHGYNPVPVLVGEGRDTTILEWDNSFTGVCIDLDGSSDHFSGGGLIGLAIRSPGDGGRGVGVRFSHSLFTVFRDVSIGGFAYQGNDGWEHGVGLWGLGNYGAIQNNQNTLFENVAIRACTTAARLSSCTQFTFNHCQFNQSHGFADLVLEGSNDISMFGGMFQSQGDSTNLPYNTYKNHDFVPIRNMGGISDGTHRYAAAGINAAVGAPVNGLVTVTGLAGMSATDVGSYLYFPAATGLCNSGIFEIVSYISASSVVVVKKNGTPESALAWEKYAPAGGCSYALYGPAYHEGTISAFVRTHAPQIGTVRLVLNGLTVNNAASLLDLNGVDTCEVRGVTGQYDPATFLWLKARNCRQIHITGGPSMSTAPQAYDLDQFSREHITVNGASALAGKSGLTNVLAPAAAEIFDIGAPGAVSLVNGYVDTVTGFYGSVVSAPGPARRAVWLPKHARMGSRPAVGTRAANQRVLSGALRNPIPAGAYPGLFIIAHLPAGYVPGGTSVRGPRVYNTGYAQMLAISIDDNSISGIGSINGYYSGGNGTSAPNTPISGRRTLAILAQPRVLNEDVSGPTYQSLVINAAGAEEHGVPATPLSAALTRIDFGDAAAGADLDIAYLAVLKRPLTLEEERAVFAAAGEYLKEPAAVNSTPFSGTFTVESVASSDPILVSLASTNAIANLPAGHQAGDRVSFIVTTPASSRILAIKPAGAETVNGASTLVLSTDYASATLWSDGTNWWRV